MIARPALDSSAKSFRLPFAGAAPLGFMALLALAWVGLDAYWLRLLNDVGLYAVLALSLNIILGHTGLFQMGHAAFYAIGAYTTAILNTLPAESLPLVGPWLASLGLQHLPVLWTMPLAGLLAALFALVVARPIIHLRGDYLLMVTIGIVEIVRIALTNNIFGITGGANGIFNIARPTIMGARIRTPRQFFLLIWGFCLVSMLLFHLLRNSRFGRALNYIKHDELAAQGSGINTDHYKLAAFVLGACWAGMTGTLFASNLGTISPQSFTFSESVLLFAIVILGGAGSTWGMILGAFLIVGLPEFFRDLASARMLFFGLAIVAMMIFRPQGIIPPGKRHYNVAKFLKKPSEGQGGNL